MRDPIDLFFEPRAPRFRLPRLVRGVLSTPSAIAAISVATHGRTETGGEFKGEFAK
jgi:hypothetical protein